MERLGQAMRRHRIWIVMFTAALVIGNLLGVARLDPMAGTISQSHASVAGDTVGAGSGRAMLSHPVSPFVVHASPSRTPPAHSIQQRHQAEQAARVLRSQLKPPPIGPIAHVPPGAEPNPGPPLPNPHTAPRADSDFSVELNATLPSSAICPLPCFLDPGLSPNVANDGKHLMATGNAFAATSADNGTTWTALDPYTITGYPTFGGPQQVVYEPSRDRMFWALDFYDYPPNNQIVLGVSAGTDLATWCFCPLPPSTFGLMTGDYLNLPQLEYSANYLYLTFNANDQVNWYATMARFPLSPLAACATVTPQVVVRSDTFRFTLTQGATDTMYWFSNYYTSGTGTGDHVRIYFWPESSMSYTYQDKAIDPYNFIVPFSGAPNCSSQDGVVGNWCEYVDWSLGTAYRSRAGYRGFGAPLLSLAWMAGPSSFTPFPYVVREYFLLSNLSYKGHDNVYNPNYAVVLPSLAAPTTRGYVGGIFGYGGGTGTGGSAQDFYPGNLLLIEDPDTPVQPWSTYFVPGALTCMQGEFYTARAWTPDGLHWITTGSYCNASGSEEVHFYVFGRARDHSAYLRWSGV